MGDRTREPGDMGTDIAVCKLNKITAYNQNKMPPAVIYLISIDCLEVFLCTKK